MMKKIPTTKPNGHTYRTGSLAHFDSSRDEWTVTSPGDPFFSTATMLATHVLQPTGWETIHEDTTHWPDKPVMRPLTKPIHHFKFMCYSHDGAGFGLTMSEAYFEYHATTGRPVPAPQRLQIGATDV